MPTPAVAVVRASMRKADLVQLQQCPHRGRVKTSGCQAGTGVSVSCRYFQARSPHQGQALCQGRGPGGTRFTPTQVHKRRVSCEVTATGSVMLAGQRLGQGKPKGSPQRMSDRCRVHLAGDSRHRVSRSSRWPTGLEQMSPGVKVV